MIVAVILLLAAAAAAWCVLRRRKYPLAPGLPPLNLFVVPAALVSAKLVAAGNAALARAPLPEPPAGVTRRRIEIPGPNAASLPLTLYAPENAAGPLPCLVYLHGGGFCFADAGYIHENVMDYARLAGCRVVFVHYRTSEKAAFPAAFADACAGDHPYILRKTEFLCNFLPQRTHRFPTLIELRELSFGDAADIQHFF